MRRLVPLAAIALSSLALPGLAQERPNTILVLDGSGSMWGQIDGVNKITIAREVVAEILADFPADQSLGFVTYGHRERGQCADIETVVPPAPGTAAEITRIVNELNPRGMTPMTDAVIAAAQALRHTEEAATVILVSDGIETCNPDPCAAARELAAAGIDFTTHVIGFDVRGEVEALMQMQCIADETGGRFLTADNATELTEALQQVVAAPPIVSLTLAARAGDPGLTDPAWHQGAEGADLPLLDGPVAWSIFDPLLAPVIDEAEGNPLTVELPAGDYIVTVHAAILERSDQEEITFTEGGAAALTAEFAGPEPEPEPEPEPALPEATVSAPAQVIVGSAFRVDWQAEGLHPRDYVTIVPAGAEEGSYGDYTRIGEATQGNLRAPAEPGLYEVRLQMEGSGRVLATTPTEVVDAEVTVTAPAQVIVGSAFRVDWQAEGLHPRDYVTIVPAGAEDGSYGDYTRISEATQGNLRAPAEPGLYEVRLQMEGSGRVLATTPTEVVEGIVTLDGPERLRAGAQVTLNWTGAIHPRDYVTIVPAGADEDSYGDYIRVGEAGNGTGEGRMTAPDEPGLYELRYHLDTGNRVMARHPFEVLAADAPMDDGAGLVVPATGRPGEVITVTWSGGSDGADQRVTLARADQADFSWISAVSATGQSNTKFTLPDTPGSYEVRFLDLTNQSVLGRAIIAVQP